MHPTKRRRTAETASALAKPFRSPLRVDPDKHKSSRVKQNDEKLHTASKDPATSSSQVANTTANTLPTEPRAYLSESLSTVTQAIKIIESEGDSGLQLLITKWHQLSQDAADDLFSTAKEQVTRMGGVAAWREKYMKPPSEDLWTTESVLNGSNAIAKADEQFEIAQDEERAEVKRFEIDQDELTDEVVDGKDGKDSFTLEMMLQQLNIDLNVIGYDTRTQQWVE